MDKMIRKAGVFEIFNHWVLAISCFILALTGYAFLFHLEQMTGIFGSFAQMKVIHNYAGIVFTGSLVISIFFYLPESLHMTGDDLKWLSMLGGYLSKHPHVPPMGKLNTGQKLAYLGLVVSGIAIAVSGFVIWLMPGVKKYILLSHLAHNIAFDYIVFAVAAHIYLATLANPGTLRIMLSGTVPLEWARKKSPKWVKEMGY
ncbi:MAG: cytochrome b/b6 domain-containing protein [Nitrospirae bacterium]|nr:cytochrome b/b6 domain-containing protein [Nitrospirota bacterium]